MSTSTDESRTVSAAVFDATGRIRFASITGIQQPADPADVISAMKDMPRAGTETYDQDDLGDLRKQPTQAPRVPA